MEPEAKDATLIVPFLSDLSTDNANDQKKSVGGASFAGAIFNVSTGMVGAGIMSIPATFKVLGIIPALFLIPIVALAVDVTVEFLLRYTQSGESVTYAGLMEESFGKFGAIALQLCVMITNLGAMIVYLMIIGDVLSGNQSEGSLHLGILQEWFGIHWWNTRVCTILFVALFVMLPLILLPRIDSLAHASAISIILAVLFVVICAGMAIYAIFEGKTSTLRLMPDFKSGVSLPDLFTTVPVFATSLGCHVNVHPIRAELDRPSDMRSAVRSSLFICVAIYFAVGFFGYLLFGDSVNADMLVNFDQAGSDESSIVLSILNAIVRLSYAVHLMLVFPVMNFSLRVNVDELLFPQKPPMAMEKTRFVSITCILLAFIYFAAIAIPSIWYFFQFMGTTTVMGLMFIFPSSIILRDVHGISTYRDRILASLLIVLAVGSSLIAITSNIYGYISKK